VQSCQKSEKRERKREKRRGSRTRKKMGRRKGKGRKGKGKWERKWGKEKGKGKEKGNKEKGKEKGKGKEKWKEDSLRKVGHKHASMHTRTDTQVIFTCESNYCFQRVLAIAILSIHLSVCPSVTWVDQSKTVQARITKSSPSAAWKTLVSGTVKWKLFHKFEGVTPNEGAKWEAVSKICDFWSIVTASQ